MRTKPTVWQIGAVVLAVVLGGSYVWFRGTQARQRQDAPALTQAPATQPASPATTKPSAEFIDLASCLSSEYRDPYPDSNAIGAGSKLNNSISAEFAVGSDICVGIEQPSDKTLPGWDK